MPWTITLSGGPGTLSIAESDNTQFSISALPEYDDNGSPQKVTTTISVDGDVALSSPSGVTDRMIQWFNQASKTKGPITVQLSLNGSPKFIFTPGNSLNSPRVTEFSANPREGTGESHWDVHLGIIVIQTPEKNGGTEGEIHDFTGEITTVENTQDPPVVVKKVWRFRAKAKTVAKAFAFVRGFRPTQGKIKSEYIRSARDNSAQATWIWDHQFEDFIKRIIEEPPKLIGNTKGGFNIGLRVGTKGGAKQLAIFHRRRIRSARIIIRGRTIGFTEVLTPPNQHVKESNNIKRAFDDETIYETVPDSVEEGTFILPWEEIYDVRDFSAIPALDHGDHNDIVVITEPSDGEVLTFEKK